MSTKFSRQRIPQPTPSVCIKGVIPPNPLPTPNCLNIALSYTPPELAPPGPPWQDQLTLSLYDPSAIYVGPELTSGYNFLVVLHADTSTYAAHLTVSYREGTTVLDYINYYPFEMSGPPLWSALTNGPALGGGGGTFHWKTYA